MNPLKKEIPYLSIALLPFVYLAFIWNKLPEKVPMHWNGSGEIDRWGGKMELILMLFMLTGLTYILFLVIPKIDPKQKFKKMGNKFDNLRLILSFFMSALALYILYSIQKQSSEPAFMIPMIGLLVAFLGNYFKTLKPNYFIGIKTPWTLESEVVWEKTHKLGGVVWFIGGLLIFIVGLFLDFKIQIYFVLGIVLILVLVPVIYSYLEFQKINKQ